MQFNYYRLIISYRGTHYQGWQNQTNKKGIADTIQSTIFSIWNYIPTIEGASRTDAGVHAVCQVAKIKLPAMDNLDQLKKIFNDHLPPDIMILDIQKTHDTFSPRFDCIMKEYQYRISFTRPQPWEHDLWWYCYYPCDKQKIRDVLALFVGKHDFASFAKYNPSNSTTVRTINHIIVQELCDNQMVITIQGKSFLRHMVRRLVGAAITAAHKDYSVEYIKHIMDQKNPSNHLYKAPACGLILQSIIY